MFIRTFVGLSIHLSVHSFIRSFVLLFVCSFVHSFIHPLSETSQADEENSFTSDVDKLSGSNDAYMAIYYQGVGMVNKNMCVCVGEGGLHRISCLLIGIFLISMFICFFPINSIIAALMY